MSSYATTDDLAIYGVPAAALTGIDAPTQQAALDTASSVVDGYLGSRFILPLTAWGADLRRAVCSIAAWDLISAQRGFNPEKGADVAIRGRYEDALRWLEQVATGRVAPAGVTDSEPATAQGPVTAFVSSTTRRGW